MHSIIIGDNYDFNSLKYIYDNYKIEIKNNIMVGVVKKTNEYTDDKRLMDKIKFSELWVKASMQDKSKNYVPRENYIMAFNEKSKHTYEYMMESIIKQLEEDGYINPLTVLESVETYNYRHGKDIISYLFSNKKYVKIVTVWGKYASGSKVKGTEPLITLKEAIEEYNINGKQYRK